MATLKFVCDSMLGRLARWLRVLGYDTLFSRSYLDSQLIDLVRKDPNRILITRDTLLNRAVNDNGGKSVLLRDNEITNQLASLKEKLNINLKIQSDISRCSFCNHPLVKVRAKDVSSLLPPKISRKQKFWYCPNCNKVFWRGRMWPNMVKIPTKAEEIYRNKKNK